MEEKNVTPMKNILSCQLSPLNSPLIHKTPLKPKNPALHCENMESLKVFSNYFTPPSRLTKFIAKNPFDVDLTSRLHLSVVSPTIFKKISPGSQDSPFAWTIDELARMKPVKIDEISHYQMQCSDPDLESKAQEAINKFFEKNQILPSPWNEKKEPTKPLISMKPTNNTSNVIDEIKISKKDCSTQTTLTLPFNLPEELETALKSYFTYSQDQQVDEVHDGNASNNSLRRKLFFNNDNDDSVDDEFDCSLIISPAKKSSSPLRSGMLVHKTPLKRFSLSLHKTRGDASSRDSQKLFSPDISPIASSYVSCRRNKSRSRLAGRLDFNGHMSIDLSQSENKENIFNKFENRSELSHDNSKILNDECDKNETVEMVSLRQEITPVKEFIDETDDIVNEIKDCGNWCRDGFDESHHIQRRIWSIGNPEQSSAFMSTQDTGYQTGHSINSTNINNTNNRSITPLKNRFHWDKRKDTSPKNVITLSNWHENIKSIFCSTPSKLKQLKNDDY